MFSRRKRTFSSASSNTTGDPLRNELRSSVGFHNVDQKLRNGRSSMSRSLSGVSIILLTAAFYQLLVPKNRLESSNLPLVISASPDDEHVDAHPRFVTVVLPSPVDPHTRHRRVAAIADTWAEAARALIVVHNLTEEFPLALSDTVWNGQQLPVDRSCYPQVLHLPQSISVQDDDAFKRLKYVIEHVYIKQKADFIFFVNDHSYVIPEHLCNYLKPFDPKMDLYAGHAMMNPKSFIFNTAAAGYILSRTTMKRLLETWDEGKECQSGKSHLRSNPDLVVAECLLDVLHVPALDTRDAGKFHRFHTYGIVRTLMGMVDQWFIDVHDRFRNISGFDESYRTLRSGSDCCSSGSISFHYVEHGETRALFDIRQHLLRDQEMIDFKVKELLDRKWPRRGLGGYSMQLPVENEDRMQDLLITLRKLSRPQMEGHC